MFHSTHLDLLRAASRFEAAGPEEPAAFHRRMILAEVARERRARRAVLWARILRALTFQAGPIPCEFPRTAEEFHPAETCPPALTTAPEAPRGDRETLDAPRRAA